MTEKLYYKDGYLAQFEATVVNCQLGEKGYEVILDQTAFYPEGGGQPADTGKLDDVAVTYVYDKEGTIYHVVEVALEVGKKVKGKIDFERRFDLMQQHSGEHIISGIVHALYGYNNVGFHMSKDYTTADFDGELTKEQVLDIETRANEAVYQNLAIASHIYQDTEIKERDYRSKLDLKGDVRLVEVPNYDTCACCGIHVKTTGEIGMIKCIASERHRGGMRLTIVCGKRALRDAQQKQEVIMEAGKMLSAKPEVITTNIAKLQEEINNYKQQLVEKTNELFAYKCREYLKTDEPMIFVYEKTLTGDDLRRLSLMLTEQTEKIVLILTGEGNQLKYALACKNQDIRPLNKVLTEALQGKGGGKMGLCQGNLVATSKDVYELFKNEKLEWGESV